MPQPGIFTLLAVLGRYVIGIVFPLILLGFAVWLVSAISHILREDSGLFLACMCSAPTFKFVSNVFVVGAQGLDNLSWFDFRRKKQVSWKQAGRVLWSMRTLRALVLWTTLESMP